MEDSSRKAGAGPVGGIAPIPPYPVDPVQGNPFPEDSPGHKIWQAATIAAERDLLHFRSHLVALPEPNNYEEIEERFIKPTVVEFEVWAKRDIAVVCDHETARYCAKRFHETAESKLKSFLENPPPQVRLESFLPKLRQRLLTVAEYWSALALNRAIPPQPDESSGMEAQAHVADASNSQANTADSFATKENRELAIKKAALQRTTTFKGLAQSIGVKYTDLRAWARDRGRRFAKGESSKTQRIEDHLLRLFPRP